MACSADADGERDIDAGSAWADEAPQQAGAPPDREHLVAFQRCNGSLRSYQGLRYKKKMHLLSVGRADRVGHVAYCMMTFVVRNGLRALRASEALYLQYVQGLVQRWALDSQQQAVCAQFAKSWAAWLRVHDRGHAVSEQRYLAAAEPFAAEFVAGTLPHMNAGSFRGIVLAIGFDTDFLGEVQAATGILGFSEASRSISWSRALPEMGYLIAVDVIGGTTKVGPPVKRRSAALSNAPTLPSCVHAACTAAPAERHCRHARPRL